MSWPEKWVPGFLVYYGSLVARICDHRLFCAYSIFHNQKTGLKVPDILIKKGYCIATKYVTHHGTPQQLGNKGNIVIILQRRKLWF